MKNILMLLYYLSLPIVFISQNIEERFEKGMTFNKEEKYLKAIKEFEYVVKHDSKHVNSYLGLGGANFGLEEYEKSINYYSEAIKLLKGDSINLSIVYSLRATAYMMNGAYKKSIKDCNASIRLNYTNDSPYYIRGKVRGQQSNYESALKDFNTAINYNAKNYTYYLDRGQAYYEVDLFEEAEVDFTLSLALSLDYESKYYRGKARFFLEKYELALDDLEDIVPDNLIFSDLAEFFYLKGSSKYYLNNYDEAISDLKSSLGYDNTVGETYYKLADAFYDNEDYENAQFYYSEYLKFNSNDMFVYNYLGLSYLNMKKYEKAEEAFCKALKIDSENYYLQNNLGRLYLEINQKENALKALNKSIGLMSSNEVNNDGEPYYYRAKLYFEDSKITEGCLDLKKAEEYIFSKEKIKNLLDRYCN